MKSRLSFKELSVTLNPKRDAKVGAQYHSAKYFSAPELHSLIKPATIAGYILHIFIIARYFSGQERPCPAENRKGVTACGL